MLRCRNVLAVLIALGLAALTGCPGAGEPGKGNPTGKDQVKKEDPGKPAGTPAAPGPAPRPSLKAAKDLKVPDGLEKPVEEIRIARSVWDQVSDYRAGDFIEFDLAGAMRMRQEIFDLADHAAVLVTEAHFKVGDMEMHNKGASKMLYTEPDVPPSATPSEYKTETKPTSRKIKVGDEELVTDKLTETYKDGKLVSRTWSSKKVPITGQVLTEDAEGKATMTLLRYGRGR